MAKHFSRFCSIERTSLLRPTGWKAGFVCGPTSPGWTSKCTMDTQSESEVAVVVALEISLHCTRGSEGFGVSVCRHKGVMPLCARVCEHMSGHARKEEVPALAKALRNKRTKVTCTHVCVFVTAHGIIHVT